MTRPAPPEPNEESLAHSFGIVGLACGVLSLAIFFVPFLDLMLALGGLLFSGRALVLYRGLAAPGESGMLLAFAALVLGLVAVIPGALVTGVAMF